ncbi:ER membrane protein complex subunit 6-like [Teleopsis dalmanni]|uniref:ER membrane protein complex subunit 6 n=1 Tax=Teleopsis dalmanni TaxID=139649 RepID=UPI0018CD96A7|nr:ER membrane protein complex subunit 6 [Teleopsis dalmanni]XP_037952719.1 ER membrane protein complex subunit 6-like [Teleopsis dalmanni]
MSNRVKAREVKPGEVVAYSEYNIRSNLSAVEYCRTSTAAISGSVAGILGLSGLIGFFFYFLTVFLLWLLILFKSGTQWRKYFINRQSLLTNGFMGGLCTYVLFWTFLYGMVHVY